MKTNNNDDIMIYIKKMNENKNMNVRMKVNESFLSDYIKICDEIKSINSPNLNICKSIEIHLNHPEMKEIIIDNEKVWKFLYNYNIIQECINKKNNIIIINFELKNLNESLNTQKTTFTKIISYILNRLPQSFYFDILFKFFKIYIDFDFMEMFTLYVIDELTKTDLKSIKAEKNKNCDDIKQLINNSEIQSKSQGNEFSKNKKNFFNIFKFNFNKNLNISDICEKNEKLKNLNPINYTSFKGNNENIIKDQIEANDIHFTQLKIDFDHTKQIDENKFFRNLNREEYYAGIDVLNDYLNKEDMNKLY